MVCSILWYHARCVCHMTLAGPEPHFLKCNEGRAVDGDFLTQPVVASVRQMRATYIQGWEQVGGGILGGGGGARIWVYIMCDEDTHFKQPAIRGNVIVEGEQVPCVWVLTMLLGWEVPLALCDFCLGM